MQQEALVFLMLSPFLAAIALAAVAWTWRLYDSWRNADQYASEFVSGDLYGKDNGKGGGKGGGKDEDGNNVEGWDA